MLSKLSNALPCGLPVSFSSTTLCFTDWNISVLDILMRESLDYVNKERQIL